MYTATTKDIKIVVDPRFEDGHSKPDNAEFVFSYTIQVFNQSDSPVQLISRQWIIFDAIGQKRKVEGDGVIGQQPIINPGQTFTYSSWCPLASEMGYMRGLYTMVNLETTEVFDVEVPKFNLIFPTKLN